MTQNIESPAELHADHRHWSSDLSQWRDDIEQWRRQHAAALQQVQQAADAIRQHGKALDQHADSMEQTATSLKYHERNVADSIRSGVETILDDTLRNRHAEQADVFEKQLEAHERIKKHHHIAMAHVASLMHALESAM